MTTATHLAEVTAWAIYEKPDIIHGASILSAEDCIEDAARWIADSREDIQTDAQFEALKATLADPQARVASGYHLARCSDRLYEDLNENGGHSVAFVIHDRVLCLPEELLTLDDVDPDQVLVEGDHWSWPKILIGGVPVCKGPGDSIERLAKDLRESETLRDYVRQYAQGKEVLPTCSLYYGQEFTCRGQRYRFDGVLDTCVEFSCPDHAHNHPLAIVIDARRLKTFQGLVSCDTLGDSKKPTARGVFRYQGQLYAATGSLGSGAEGTMAVWASPVVPVDKPAAVAKVAGSAAYSYQPSLFD